MSMTRQQAEEATQRAKAKQQRQQQRKAGNSTAPPPRVLDLIWADDIDLTADLRKVGLVDGLLGADSMTVAYGESGCGKTFIAVDLACRIAAGWPWHGMDTQQGLVVYVAAESPKSVEHRVSAWMRHQKVCGLPLVVVRSTVNLLDGDTDLLIDTLAKIQAKRGRIALVVIDTLARAMVGNENSSEDMGAFVAACGRIREAASSSILIVHHSGKDQAKGARGWSGLRAATDVELEIAKGTIKVSKSRDAPGGNTYGFRLEQVVLGHNAKGRKVTTCVALELATAPQRQAKRAALRSNAKVVFDALKNAIAAGTRATPPPAPQVPAGVQGITTAQWEAAAMQVLPQTDVKRRREAFNRATPSIVGNGYAHCFADFVWLA